jgi:hypothetical protein
MTLSLKPPSAEINGEDMPIDETHKAEDVLNGSVFRTTRYVDDDGDLLKETIRDCLAYDPAERPTLDDLRKRVDRRWGVRDEDKNYHFVIPKDTEYAVGRVLPASPQKAGAGVTKRTAKKRPTRKNR